MCNIAIILSKRGLIAKLCLSVILSFPVLGYAQSLQFSNDSIPVVNGEIIFRCNFDYDLNKEEFRKRTYSYLNKVHDPYSGVFLKNTADSTVCKITDYLDIESNAINVFGMYMTYNLRLAYSDGSCSLAISDFTYMEKGYFETQEESERKLDMPELSGNDIMIDKKYTRLMTRGASEKITTATVNRINEIVKNLDLSFVKK